MQLTEEQKLEATEKMLGSGSTMIASHQLDRKCYGIDIEPKYCEVTIQRMIKLDETLVITRNGKEETQIWLNKIANNTK